MTAALMTLLLSSVLLLAALGGPWLLRQAAPALSGAPRFAAVAVSSTALLWVAALVALGPIVAWMSEGPAWLPKPAAEVCDRCLSAASPFAQSAVSLGIPAIIPLTLPVFGTIAVLIGLMSEFRNIRRSQASLAATVRENSDPMTLLGRRVRVTREMRPQAFALPHRHGGVIVSRGALHALTAAELSAVLEHEQAHLTQRHHLCLAILNGATRYFRWVPYVQAVRAAVPHYLEIAADRIATAQTGTPALAGALLKLGQPSTPEISAPIATHAALHAAGSERVRHLIGHPKPPASVALAAAIGAYAFMLTAVVASVHWPYVLAVATGC